MPVRRGKQTPRSLQPIRPPDPLPGVGGRQGCRRCRVGVAGIPAGRAACRGLAEGRPSVEDGCSLMSCWLFVGKRQREGGGGGVGERGGEKWWWKG